GWGPVRRHPAQSHHDLQSDAHLPAGQRGGIRARRRLRRLDDRHAGPRHELLGAADSAERRDLSGRPGLRADFLDAVRGARAMTTALVIVPTYNERENLAALVEGLLRHPNVRLLIVDDQSPDGTGELADDLARRHPGRIDVMHRVGRRGLGRSYVDG